MRDGTSRREALVWSLVLAAVLAVFLWVSGAPILSGVNHADDAWSALTSRTLALGQGFARPLSSDQLIAWDPLITTGPGLVVPTALAIALFGPLDPLPGSVVLVMFLAQLAVSAILLKRRHSTAAVASFGAVLMCLMILVATHSWYFGIGIGEAVAFGFVLLSAVTLDTSPRRLAIVLGGICAGLAFITKFIALFPVVGIGLAFWALASRRHGARIGFVKGLAFAFGFVLPVGAVELVKLAQLGINGYVSYWIGVAHITNVPGSPPADYLARPGVFLQTIEAGYVPVLALAVLAAGALALQHWLRSPGPAGGRVDNEATLGVLLLGAVAGHFAYVLLVSTLYVRYFWVGMALLMVALATPILRAQPRARIAALGLVVVLIFTSGAFATIAARFAYARADAWHRERMAVVRLLEQRPTTPYIAQAQTSLYDIVYLRQPAGTWAFGANTGRFQGQSVIAVLNQEFTDQTSDLYPTVLESCTPLTPTHRLIRAYDCGAQFWLRYLPSTQLAAIAPEGLNAATPTSTTCSVDHAAGIDQPRGTVVLANSTNLWLFGWAIDADHPHAPDATYVVFDGDAGQFYAPTVSDRRPALGRALGNANYERAGYRVSLSAVGVPHGMYRLSLLTESDGALRRCVTGLTLSR